jgi:excisionase family DNA binding protein
MSKHNINSQPTYDRTQEIKELERVFAQDTCLKLVSTSGKEILLPESVYQIVEVVVRKMAAGEEIHLVPNNKQLTTQEAADLLNVSRPYLIKLLEQGEIPYEETLGKHRRVALEDLVAYKERRSLTRKKNLQKTTEFLQEQGFYEYNGSDDNCD